MPKNYTLKSNQKTLVSIICFSWALFVVGCASPGNVQLMVPPVNQLLKPVVNNTVWVSYVSGGGNEKDISDEKAALRFVATNEEFRQALLLTLRRSNLFQSIGDENSDLELRVEIKRQEISPYRKVSMFEWRAFIGVAYEIIDRKSGHIVWKEAYLSEAGHVQTGAVHAVKAARENSVRESLACFINRVSSQWPQLSYHAEAKTDFRASNAVQNTTASTPQNFVSLETTETSGTRDALTTKAAVDSMASNPLSQPPEPLSKLDVSNKPSVMPLNSLAILPINASIMAQNMGSQMYSSTKKAVVEKLEKLFTDDQQLKLIYNYYDQSRDSSYSKQSSSFVNENTINNLWVEKSIFSDNRELNTDFAIEIGKKLNANLVFTCDVLPGYIKVFLIDVNKKKIYRKDYTFSPLSGYTAAPASLDDFYAKYKTNLLK